MLTTGATAPRKRRVESSARCRLVPAVDGRVARSAAERETVKSFRRLPPSLRHGAPVLGCFGRPLRVGEDGGRPVLQAQVCFGWCVCASQLAAPPPTCVSSSRSRKNSPRSRFLHSTRALLTPSQPPPPHRPSLSSFPPEPKSLYPKPFPV